MIEQQVVISAFHPGALDAALRAALPGKVSGISSYGAGRPVSIWLDDSATAGDQTTVSGVIAAHDPVFISVDKTLINANGVDTITVTVQAPKQGAAGVTLAVNGNDLPVTLVNGVGTDTITSLDPSVFNISVKNGANRCNDTIRIEAI